MLAAMISIICLPEGTLSTWCNQFEISWNI